MKNYYEILEVSNKASMEIIEKSYKVLVKKYHPDIQNPSSRYFAEEALKDINEAYSVLSDAHLRQAYDREYNKVFAPKYAEDDYKNIYREARAKEYNYSAQNKEEKVQSKKAQKQIVKSKGISGIVENIITSFKNLKNADYRAKQKNEFSQKLIAIALTVLIMGTVIFILWSIPFTRSWITGV